MNTMKITSVINHSDWVEKSLIGWVLYNPEWCDVNELDVNLFMNPTNLQVLKSLKEISSQGWVPSIISLKDKLVEKDLFWEWKIDTTSLIDYVNSACKDYEFMSVINVLKWLNRKVEVEKVVEKIQIDTERSSSSLISYAEELIRIASVWGDKSSSVDKSDVEALYTEISEKVGKDLFGYSWWENLKFLDKNTRWIQKGITYRIGGASNVGKAMPLYEKVLTPKWFIEIWKLSVWDEVINSDWWISHVSWVFPQWKKHVYRFHFNDKTSVDSCENHLWKVYSNDWRWKSKVLEVKSIIKAWIKNKSNKWNRFSIPIPKPIEFNSARELEIHPYVLWIIISEWNIWNSHIQITNNNQLVKDRVSSLLVEWDRISTYSSSSITYWIVWHNTFKSLDKYWLKLHRSYEKFIPKDYLFSSIESRKQLLEWLIDWDWWVDDSSYVYATSSYQLSLDVEFLARSLWWLASTTKRIPTFSYKWEKKKWKVSYNVRISLPFKLNCSVDYKNNIADRKRKLMKKLVDATYVWELDCVCISVTSNDKLYVTSWFVLTHNTQMMYNVINSLMKQNAKVAFFTLENRKSMTLMYILSNYQRISSKLIEQGESSWDYDYLVWLKDKLFIIESLYDIDSIFTKCLEIKPDVVILDYIWLVEIRRVQEEAKYTEYAKRVQQFVKRTWISWIDLSNLPRDLQSAENIRASPQFYWSTFLRNNTDVGIHLYYNKELYEHREAVMELAEPDSPATLAWKDKQFINLFLSKNRIWPVWLEQIYKVDFSKWALYLELSRQDRDLILNS